MRHGESTEFDVVVIFVGEWIVTADVLRFLDGVDVRFAGVAEDRFDTERGRREESEIEGAAGAESGSGEEERVDMAEGDFYRQLRSRSGVVVALGSFPGVVRCEARECGRRR
jgi:hypothetical protein